MSDSQEQGRHSSFCDCSLLHKNYHISWTYNKFDMIRTCVTQDGHWSEVNFFHLFESLSCKLYFSRKKDQVTKKKFLYCDETVVHFSHFLRTFFKSQPLHGKLISYDFKISLFLGHSCIHVNKIRNFSHICVFNENFTSSSTVCWNLL